MNNLLETILIVDDEPQNCKLLEALLKPRGYITRVAVSGEEALASVAQQSPSLILLDVMMPGMDGYEVAGKLKANPATAYIPIIMVTAHIDRAARLRGLDVGAEDFLTKPVDHTELWLRVRNLLRIKTLSDFLLNHNQHLEHEVQERAAELHRFRTAMDATVDGIVLVDHGTMRFIEANATACKMLGYAREELFEMAPWQVGASTAEELDRIYNTIIAGGSSEAVAEIRLRRKDGSEFPAEVHRSAHRFSAGWTLVDVWHDISERRAQEEKIARLNRVYAVLSGINTLIVRTRSREDLLREVCRISVEVGQFRMAMIGIVSGGALKPVAVAGFDEGYVIDHFSLDVSGTNSMGGKPVADALREKRALVCNDIANDAAAAPSRDAALLRNYGSSATLPLLESGELIGCISLYAVEADFFDEDELKLLTQLAGEVSYALDFIARDEKLDYLAYYDPLTKLANRRLFIDRLAQHLDAVRKTNQMLAVVLMDAEHFKAINDEVGRAGGDELLKLQAARLLRFTGNANYLARFSADLFAVVIPSLKHPSDLTAFLVEKMHGRLSQPHRLGDRDVRLTSKMGIALFPDDGENAESLVSNAESALKRAKSSGERYLFYTPQMSAALKKRLSLETMLRHGIERQEFKLHYQPKVELIGGLICGAEALLRWESPELGTVMPDDFIPVMEDTGMILEVGLWALKQAVADRARWMSEGLRVPRLAVNVSAVQLRQPEFLESFKSVLSVVAGTDPGIDIEVTESMLMTDISEVVVKLSNVAECGVKIAIDDFGTGYSSLTYLSQLPIHALKIDKSFVARMVDSSDTIAIVSAIISLSHAMRLKVIAEGVDSLEQLKLLRLLRCDELQGWLFSKALPAEGFARLLLEGRRLALT